MVSMRNKKNYHHILPLIYSATIMCLNIGTTKIINFPFDQNGMQIKIGENRIM